jgi:hypothetical protein
MPAKEINMLHICLLTDEQKSMVFEGDYQYTAKDIDDLSVIALAEKSLIRAMQSFNFSNEGKNDPDSMIGLLNVLEWLNAPIANFLCEASLWGNIPENMKEPEQTA